MNLGEVQFNVNGKLHKFKVINDMPETIGLSLDDAVNNWLARTDDYSVDSFCKYVESKGTGFICVKPTPANMKKYGL